MVRDTFHAVVSADSLLMLSLNYCYQDKAEVVDVLKLNVAEKDSK